MGTTREWGEWGEWVVVDLSTNIFLTHGQHCPIYLKDNISLHIGGDWIGDVNHDLHDLHNFFKDMYKSWSFVLIFLRESNMNRVKEVVRQYEELTNRRQNDVRRFVNYDMLNGGGRLSKLVLALALKKGVDAMDAKPPVIHYGGADHEHSQSIFCSKEGHDVHATSQIPTEYPPRGLYCTLDHGQATNNCKSDKAFQNIMNKDDTYGYYVDYSNTCAGNPTPDASHDGERANRDIETER